MINSHFMEIALEYYNSFKIYFYNYKIMDCKLFKYWK